MLRVMIVLGLLVGYTYGVGYTSYHKGADDREALIKEALIDYCRNEVPWSVPEEALPLCTQMVELHMRRVE